MDFATVFFLSSGLFLGWSLGANDAANVFGTAVGARMIRFTTAAMMVPAISEFDIAMGRTKMAEGE